MNIRKALTEDVPKLGVLFDLYRVFYNKQSDIEAACNFIGARIQNNDSVIFIAENPDGQICGFTQLYPLLSSTRMQKLWLLNDLYVLGSERGQGISKLLIDAAMKIAKETKACGIMLETAKTNIIGNKLYPSAGFRLEENSNLYFWTNNNISQ